MDMDFYATTGSRNQADITARFRKFQKVLFVLFQKVSTQMAILTHTTVSMSMQDSKEVYHRREVYNPDRKTFRVPRKKDLSSFLAVFQEKKSPANCFDIQFAGFLFVQYVSLQK